MMNKILYTVKEVAEIMHTNTTYEYKVNSTGLLPALKLGSFKIRHETLMNFLEQYEGKDLTNPENIPSI